MTERDGDASTLLEAGGPNAVAVANGIVADEWTLWIVQLAMHPGVTRYNDWFRSGPISSSVLTTRLTRLVEVGVMERTCYSTSPRRHEYVLTARGRQMWPIMVTMWAWERRWTKVSPGGVPRLRHAVCDEEFEPVLVCSACGTVIEAEDVERTFGPSWTWERSAPAAETRRRHLTGPRPNGLVVQAMAVIGNRWSAALLNSALLGATRFREFEVRTGAPSTVVAERLRTLCELGFLARSSEARHAQYRLTAKGRSFYPVMAELLEWGQRWFVAPEGPALHQRHADCGADFHPRLRCDRCQAALRGCEVTLLWDGAPPVTVLAADRAVLRAATRRRSARERMRR